MQAEQQAVEGRSPGPADAEEVLIPFVDAYVGTVDLAGRQVHVDWQADY